MSILDENILEQLDYNVLYRERFEKIEATLDILPSIIYKNTEDLREDISEHECKLDSLIAAHKNEILIMQHKINILTDMINSLLPEDKHINLDKL